MRFSLSRLLWLLAAPAALASVSACGLVLGLEDGVYVDGGVDGFIAPDAGGGDALADSFEPPKDVIDIETNFASCDGAPPIVAAAVYVSPNGTDSVSCGKPSAPCKTVMQAIKVAAATADKTVYLAAGSYDEQVTINSVTENGTTIQGGFDTYPDAAWVPNCDQQKAIIKSKSTSYTMLIDGRTATLRLLRIESRDQAPADESVYALIVNDASVTLDNTILLAQNGGRGSDGGNGVPTASCFGGGGGAVGAAGLAGTFGNGEYAPTTAGMGEQGAVGTSTPGTMGACDNTCGTCGFPLVLAGDAGPDAGPPPDSGVPDSGVPDSGVPDGGPPDGGTCVFTPGSKVCGNTGFPGCGGSGGAGGGGGNGGGASIALYIKGIGPKVTLIGGVSLNTANGGNGGTGGLGGTGGPGGTGNDGASQPCETGCANASTCSGHMVDGGAGGVGTAGGSGGQGGGGAGGPTYLWVSPNTAFFDALLAPKWKTNSMLGSAGTGGLPNGPKGEALESRQIP